MENKRKDQRKMELAKQQLKQILRQSSQCAVTSKVVKQQQPKPQQKITASVLTAVTQRKQNIGNKKGNNNASKKQKRCQQQIDTKMSKVHAIFNTEIATKLVCKS